MLSEIIFAVSQLEIVDHRVKSSKSPHPETLQEDAGISATWNFRGIAVLVADVADVKLDIRCDDVPG